jgi:Putative lumazine-binding
MRGLALLAAVFIAASGVPVNAEHDDRAKVIAVVQTLFDAMAPRDVAMAQKVVLPDARFTSVREEAGKRVIRSRAIKEDLAKWAALKEAYLERMWDPEVRFHGPLAVVTTPYDFHIDGVFTHCGIDVFELLETDDGWRLASGTYTVQKEGCAPSPLGPPKAK